MGDRRIVTGFTRREFMRRLSSLGGAAAGASALRALGAASNASTPLTVIVVGAGLAGLSAAYELEQRGHRVIILEADPRHVGGRVRTVRFAGGLYGEAGAMRIPTGHVLTRHYVREFGLPLRKFVYTNPQAYYFLRGERHRRADVAAVGRLYDLREDERSKTPDDLWNDSVGKAVATLGDEERKDLHASIFATAKVRALDQQTLQQLCEAAGLSQEAIEFLAGTSAVETTMPTASTETLREEIDEVWSAGFDEIVGGTDLVASAFAQRLRAKPKTGCVVSRITQDATRGRAAAMYREGGIERRVEGDFLICTLPCPVLAAIPIEPSLSGAKARAIRTLNYDSSIKLLAVTGRRFWETDDGIYGGGTYSDLPFGMCYYPSDNAQARDPRVSAAPTVLLASYNWGAPARRLASLPHKDRETLVVEGLGRVHPQLRERGMIRHTASWSWDNHPYSRGAFAWFTPGQHTELYRYLIAPEGRIHFAGEHASLSHTWMQGALESGTRAAREILEAAQR